MAAERTPEASLALLARETRWRLGVVPSNLGGVAVLPGYHMSAEGCFLSRQESGYGFLYRPGEGITIERPQDADLDEEALWLNGSVYAAVACLNGFLPLHASAVAHDGRVIAFTGAAGAGKSTLAAGLGKFGFPLFCDDTLLIDLANLDQAICMPGHKRLKLLPDALSLTGAAAEQPVGADTGKTYCRPLAGVVGEPLPLEQLVFLAEGPELRWDPIRGAERFVRLEDDHHTQDLFMASHRPGRAELFALRAQLANKVKMAQLTRPRSAEGFAASLELVAGELFGKELTQ
jgi:hypothetical protein